MLLPGRTRVQSAASAYLWRCASVQIGCSFRRWQFSSAASAGVQPDAAGAAAPNDDAIVLTGRHPHYVHPSVQAAWLPGKGRGLITTTPLAAGDLVMCAHPMACVLGPRDEQPDPASLLPLLRKLRDAGAGPTTTAGSALGAVSVHLPMAPALARQWMGVMFKGDEGATPTSSSSSIQQEVDAVNALLKWAHLHQPAPAAPNHTAAAAPPTPTLSDAQVEGMVYLTAFGDAFEDLAAVDLRKQQQQPGGSSSDASGDANGGKEGVAGAETSHTGVWPHFSLLNHSCLPNCVHYVVGTQMVVRAVRAVEAGRELTVSYLGREEFSPVSVRGKVLQDRYSFTCTCPRCTLEARLPPATTSLLRDLHSDATLRLAPWLGEAAEAGDRDSLNKLNSELVSWSHKLHPVLESFIGGACGLEGQGQAPTPPGSAPSPSLHDLQQGTITTTTSSGGGAGRNTRTLTLGDVAAASTSSAAPGTGSGASPPAAGLGDAVGAVGGPEAAVLCVEAAVYDYLELLQQHAALTTEMEQADGAQQEEPEVGSSTAALSLCTQVLHATSKGSELHVFQAARLLELATAGDAAASVGVVGPDADAAVEVAHTCEEAHVARYGYVTPATMAALARANANRSHEFIV